MTSSAARLAGLLTFGLVAACAPLTEDAPAEAEPDAVAADPAGDVCGASRFQDLVGTNVGELRAADLPQPNRVIFPGMSVTMDFVPERLNVEIGTNDRVTRVRCG